MNLSNSGRIILIDDKIEEALPLLSTLGKESIPYIYYDGRPTGFPAFPQEGIRFVFLDIELQGMEGQGAKTKASAIVGRLKKIISTSNGPYVIVFWTKHTEIISQVIDNCSKASIAPVAWIDLEKVQCVNTQGEYDLAAISGRLKEKLKDIGAFRLYVEWENILRSASNNFVNEFSKLIPADRKWSDTTSALFYRLYKAYVEKNELDDPAEQFKCACLLMNRSFIDILQKYSEQGLKLPDGFRLLNSGIDKRTISKLNSYLFLSSSMLSRPMTGNVYSETNKKIKICLLEGIFKAGQLPGRSKLCKVIITPGCDLAQNKVLKQKNHTKENKMHRIVYGLLLPSSPDLSGKINKNDAQFPIGDLWHAGKSWYIILHFSTLSFQHEGQFPASPLFNLRSDLVFDIQSKAANHVNRLGHFELG